MKKILIVEDDPIVAHIYKSRLEKEGYEVEVSPDGQSGFYRIHEFRPEAVLLDLMLPKMNGVEILKKIRAQPQFGKTPIIVFTNAYVPNMIHESFQAGATQVFNKATLTPRQIIEAIQNAISVAARPSLESKGDPTVSSGSSESDDDSSAANNESPSGSGDTTDEAAPSRTATNADGAEASGFQDSDSSSDPFLNAGRTPKGAGAPKDSEFQAELFQTFIEAAP